MIEIVDHSDYHLMIEEKIINLNKQYRFSIREVHFDKHNNPISYSNVPVVVEFNSIDLLETFIERSEKVPDKDIYWVGSKFPQTFKINNNGNKEN